MVLIRCSTIYFFRRMTNNFYNINIGKYNPAEHNHSGGNSPLQINQQQNVLNNPYQGQHQVQTNPNGTQEQLTLPAEDSSGHARLNALDSTILINEAYQNIDDEVFKTEYQISKLEEGIAGIDKEIEQARAINDTTKADILIMRKHSMQEKLRELSASYGEQDVTAKLSDGITSVFSKKPTIITNIVDSCVNFVSEKILPKVSKKYNSGRDIKIALNKLETLNKNVDELVTMQMPYGEADERYDMLTNYLNRANVIHFNISKTIGTPTFFDTISSIDKEKFNEVRKNSSNFGNMTTKPNHHKMKVEGQG